MPKRFIMNGNANISGASSLDVCQGGSIFDDWKGFFLSQDVVTNVAEFQPTSDEYYDEKVRPRVAPWAAPLFAVSLALLLGFVIWRSLRLRLCSCCVGRCAREDFCQPAKVNPDRLLRSRRLLALRAIITALLGVAVAFSCWGIATAGPKVAERFWARLDDVSAQASDSLSSASTTANLTEHMSTEGLALVDYVSQFMTVDADEDPFLCLKASMVRVPGMLEEVFGSLREAEELLFQPGKLLPSGQAALSAFATLIQDSWIDKLLTTAWTAGETPSLVQQIRSSLGDSISAYEDLILSGGSPGRTQDVIDSNKQLEFAENMATIDATVAKLEPFDRLLSQGSPLQAAVAELESYAAALMALEAKVLPEALTVVNSASKISDDALLCIGDVAPRVNSITQNVFKLPGKVDEAISTLKSDLSSVAATKEVVEEAIYEIDGLSLVDNVQALLAQMSAAQALITPALSTVPLRTYLIGADNMSGLRGALDQAQQFTELSDIIGKKYVGSPGEEQLNLLSVTISPALSSLRSVQDMVAVGSPAWEDALTSLKRIEAFREALKAISESQLDLVFGRLKQLMAGSKLQELEELRESIHKIINSASVEIDNVVKDAITQGAAFMVHVKTALEDLQNASQSVLDSKSLPGMARATGLMELARQQMSRSMEELERHRAPTVAMDEARLQASYGLFGSVMFICCFVVAGVWLGVPFLYGFFTLGLLVTMLITLTLFVPYGTAVVVGSDSCQLMEEKLLDMAASHGLDPETQQLASAAVGYYVFGQPNGTFEDFVRAEIGVDMRKTVQSMLYYRNRMIIAMETWQLAPVLYDKMASLVAAVDNAVVSTGGTMSYFDYGVVSSAYGQMKAEVCCSVAGTAGMQWLFLLCVGAILMVASVFIFVFIHLMDHLEVHCSGCVSFLGLYRHPTQPRPLGHFVLEAEAKPADLKHIPESDLERTESGGKIQAAVLEATGAARPQDECDSFWISPPAKAGDALQTVHVHCHKVSLCEDQLGHGDEGSDDGCEGAESAPPADGQDEQHGSTLLE